MKNLLLITSIFAITVIECHSQEIERFLRPYADKVIQNTTFEFSDKNTNQKYTTTDNLPVNQNLEIESEYLHWRYTSALAYEGLFELGKTLNEESYINFPKNAFAFFFNNKSYCEKIKEKGYNIEGLQNFMRFKGVWDDGALTAALINIYQDEEIPGDYMDYLNQVAEFFFEFD